MMLRIRLKAGLAGIAVAAAMLGANTPAVHAQRGGLRIPPLDASQNQPAPAKIDKKEEEAYKAYHNAAPGDAKTQLGEDFDQKYPSSRYNETVESELVTAYYNKQDWQRFYAMADKVTTKNPDNVTVLTLVGWVIPRIYDPNDPTGATKLDQSERYEKHALDVIGTLTKPAQVSDADFQAAKEAGTAQAHSGLGMTYFRRQDYEDSAKELAIAVQSPNPDPTDLYVLGTDLENLNRNPEAADAFTKCSQMPGSLQDRCKAQADATRKVAPAK
jgi:tetratricopeptide (TPR) repeat protein